MVADELQGRKSRGDDSDIRHQRAKLQVSIQNLVSQRDTVTYLLHLSCLPLTVHTGIPAAPAGLGFRGGLDVGFLALKDRPPRIWCQQDVDT